VHHGKMVLIDTLLEERQRVEEREKAPPAR
jgi:hypothetical protein